MGRPWEYSRVRRVAMQAAMWVTLAATLGLAQFIAYERGHALAALGPAKSWEDLEVRLPEDWPVVMAGDGILEARSEKDAMAVALEISPRSASGEVSGGKTEPISFGGLGRTGTMSNDSQLLRRGNRQIEDRIQVLTARVALDGSRELEIQLQDRAPRLPPADRALLRQIAASITRAQGGGREPAAQEFAAQMHVSLGAIHVDQMQQGDTVIFSLSNAPPSGAAKIVLKHNPPRKIVLRLNGFDRLDSFTVSNDRYRVQSDEAAEPQIRRLSAEGQWMRIPYNPKFQMTVEQKADSVEVVLPAALYTGNLSPLLVKWEQTASE